MITQSSASPKPPLGKAWARRWVLGTGLIWAIALGLPLGIADLIAGDMPLAQRYDSYIAPALLLWMLGLGLGQWAMLRRPLGISAWWIGSFSLPLVLLFIPLVAMAPRLDGATAVILLGAYPLLLSCYQWWLLRQRLRPVWGWVLVSLVAIAVAIPTGFIWAVMLTQWSTNPMGGVLAFTGGGIGGLLYGLITSLGLGKITGEKLIQAAPTVNPSGLDVPPGDKPWQRLIISNLMCWATLLGWGWILPRPDFFNAGESIFGNPVALLALGGFLIVYNYISILVHELGHLIFALRNGFEIGAIAVDRFVLVRSGRGLKLNRIVISHSNSAALLTPGLSAVM